MKRILAVLLAAVVLGSFGMASAATITPSFTDTLTNFTANPGLPNESIFASHSYTADGVTYSDAANMAIITAANASLGFYGGTTGSILSQAVQANAGDTYSFWWLFDAQDYLPFNDFAKFYVWNYGNGGPVSSLLSDIATVGNYGNSGWHQFTYTFTESFNGVVGFMSSNANDAVGPSTLVIGTYAPADVVTPEPSTIVLVGAGLMGLGLAAWRRRS